MLKLSLVRFVQLGLLLWLIFKHLGQDVWNGNQEIDLKNDKNAKKTFKKFLNNLSLSYLTRHEKCFNALKGTRLIKKVFLKTFKYEKIKLQLVYITRWTRKKTKKTTFFMWITAG